MSGYYGPAVWLICTHPGCDVGIQADARHVQNLTASGGWYCHLHDNDQEAV